MATDVAIDVGTSTTRVATAERGVILTEPTVVAINTGSGDVVEVGRGALAAVAHTPEHVVAFRPLANGATIDFDVAARLFRALLDRAGLSRMTRVRAVMGVPSAATPIERRALRQAMVHAGAIEASLVESPMAAAIGLGMPVQEPVASAVVTLGAGASEAALISLGGIVVVRSLRLGGLDADAAVANMLHHHYGVVAAPVVVEQLRVALASALGRSDGEHQSIIARTVDAGEPVVVEVQASDVNASITEIVQSIVRMVQETLGEAPPDLAQDVLMQGLSLTGGFARLRDVAELLATETGVSVHLATEPELVNITGLERCVRQMATMHSLFRDAER